MAAQVLSPDVETSPERERSVGATQLDGKPTMAELREHASTITEILEVASERVERLAAADAGAPALVDAIRQELSLTRRWNSHLSTILLDVAEERRVLGERERLAAREVERMTAVAEEARRELVALKNVLKGPADDSAQRDQGKRSHYQEERTVAGLIDPALADLMIGGDSGSHGGLQAVRTTLAAVREAETSAKRDVDAVRARIIDVLQTLASQHGYLPTGERGDGGEMSSEDITAWAASMATRLNRDVPVQRD